MSTAKNLYEHGIKSGVMPRPVMDHLRVAEGFRGMPYADTLGKPTIGVGTLLPLTEDEAMLLALCRGGDSRIELHAAMTARGIEWSGFSGTLYGALLDASFQLGVPRLMLFRRMWAAIGNEAWNEAADEALDSRWAKQTPRRAQALATALQAERG